MVIQSGAAMVWKFLRQVVKVVKEILEFMRVSGAGDHLTKKKILIYAKCAYDGLFIAKKMMKIWASISQQSESILKKFIR